jgi:hypothetical protein
LARNKPLFKLNWTRNKSGALLLTMLEFTIRRGDERLTKGGAESAVYDGNHPAIGEARLKHAAFNRTRASPDRCSE